MQMETFGAKKTIFFLKFFQKFFEKISNFFLVFLRQKFPFAQTIKIYYRTWGRKCFLRPVEAPKCLKQCFRQFLVVFEWCTSETRLYQKTVHLFSRSNPIRLKISISPTRTPNLIKIDSVEILGKVGKDCVFSTFGGAQHGNQSPQRSKIFCVK